MLYKNYNFQSILKRFLKGLLTFLKCVGNMKTNKVDCVKKDVERFVVNVKTRVLYAWSCL